MLLNELTGNWRGCFGAVLGYLGVVRHNVEVVSGWGSCCCFWKPWWHTCKVVWIPAIHSFTLGVTSTSRDGVAVGASSPPPATDFHCWHCTPWLVTGRSKVMVIMVIKFAVSQMFGHATDSGYFLLLWITLKPGTGMILLGTEKLAASTRSLMYFPTNSVPSLAIRLTR